MQLSSDFRLLDYFRHAALVSLFTNAWSTEEKSKADSRGDKVRERLAEHPQWDSGKGWKNFLNNLRLITLPFLCFNLILPWLKVFPIPQLSLGFPRLIALMNFFPSAVPQPTKEGDFQFSYA